MLLGYVPPRDAGADSEPCAVDQLSPGPFRYTRGPHSPFGNNGSIAAPWSSVRCLSDARLRWTERWTSRPIQSSLGATEAAAGIGQPSVGAASAPRPAAGYASTITDTGSREGRDGGGTRRCRGDCLNGPRQLTSCACAGLRAGAQCAACLAPRPRSLRRWGVCLRCLSEQTHAAPSWRFAAL